MPTIAAIDAGASVILDNLGTFNPGALFNAARVAEEVYAAMAALEPKPKAAIVLKLDTSALEATLAEFAATVAEFKSAVEAATTGGE